MVEDLKNWSDREDINHHHNIVESKNYVSVEQEILDSNDKSGAMVVLCAFIKTKGINMSSRDLMRLLSADGVSDIGRKYIEVNKAVIFQAFVNEDAKLPEGLRVRASSNNRKIFNSIDDDELSGVNSLSFIGELPDGKESISISSLFIDLVLRSDWMNMLENVDYIEVGVKDNEKRYYLKEDIVGKDNACLSDDKIKSRLNELGIIGEVFKCLSDNLLDNHHDNLWVDYINNKDKNKDSSWAEQCSTKDLLDNKNVGRS